MPLSGGGQIANGTWVATSAKVYGSSQDEGKQASSGGAVTLRLTGMSFEAVVTGASETWTAGAWAALDGVLGFQSSCIDPAGAPVGDLGGRYYATATTLSVRSPQDTVGEVLEVTYTKM